MKTKRSVQLPPVPADLLRLNAYRVGSNLPPLIPYVVEAVWVWFRLGLLERRP